MARTKQPAPIRREVSSEYTGKQDRVPSSNKEMAVKGAKGVASTNPGALQLLICVAGIYGSL